MEKTLETMTIADVMVTESYNIRLRSRVEQFKKVTGLKPVCREVLELTLEDIKNSYAECVAGTCKRFSLVQRQFIRMMIESSLRAEIKALKRNHENNDKTSKQ